MSKGKWKQNQDDQVIIVRIPLTDEVQIKRWYEPWRILVRAAARIHEQDDRPANHVPDSVGRITLGYGNQPPAWIPPWTPMTVARVMGIKFENDEEEEEAPEIEEAPKTVTTLRDAFPQAN